MGSVREPPHRAGTWIHVGAPAISLSKLRHIGGPVVSCSSVGRLSRGLSNRTQMFANAMHLELRMNTPLSDQSLKDRESHSTRTREHCAIHLDNHPGGKYPP